jgi:trehalose 6-phosphate synthase/phosphatase
MSQSEENKNPRLLIISNRLPFVIENEDGHPVLKSGSGGLTTALAPVLRNRGGIWLGWTGTEDGDQEEILKLCKKHQKTEGFEFAPIFLSKEEISLYYEGFSNEIIWPLFHDLQTKCHFVPEYWDAYQSVNQKFADGIQKKALPGDFIWVHDYHLMQLGEKLRALGAKQKIGFFLHIPFPPLDIFLKLPWRFQIIQALLQYDLIGFQTMRDSRNFIQCIKTLMRTVRVESTRTLHLCQVGEREVRVGSFPISIDFNEFDHVSQDTEVKEAAKLIKGSVQQQKIVLSIDRLDYTKGIMYRLEAIRRFLILHPEFHKKVQFIQLVVPSRAEIPKYHQLKEEINRLVGEINSQFTFESWVPIHHLYRSFNRKELIAHYRAAEVILITPVKDGMNLVAKEYVASSSDDKGILILSEFAGAAAQLCDEAILVNPYDIIGVAESINKALTMSEKDMKQRMHKMRRDIKRNNIFSWVEHFLLAAIEKELKDFPQIMEYIPSKDS